MADLPKRDLGRTKLHVTILGYGAMELRVPPWTRNHRGSGRNHPQRCARRRHQLSRHLDRLWAQRGAHRPLHRAPTVRVLSGEQMRLPGRCRPRPHAASATATSSPATNPRRRRTESQADENRLPGRGPVPLLAVEAALEEHGALDTVLELQQAGMCASSACPPPCRISDHVAMGVFDVFQIPYSALEREHEAVISAAAEAGRGYRHPRRRGQGRPF